VTPSLLAYLSTTFFLVITPGATTAVIIQQTIAGGARAGIRAAGGAASANACYGAAAAVGVAVLLDRWPYALAALRVAGGAYLCWIGARALGRAWIGARRLETGAPLAAGAPFRAGLMVTLLNPSIATFYFAVVPGFLAAPAGALDIAPLAAIHVTMAFGFHLLWALALTGLRQHLTRPAALRAVEATAGVALLLLGVRLWFVR